MKNKKNEIVKTEDQVQVGEHTLFLQRVGKDIIESTARVGEKYFELCEGIRKNLIAPKLVSHVLQDMGFHKVRISEINRVAMSSDENWSKFTARVIGFDKVLELERDTVKRAILDIGGVSEKEIEEEIEAEETGASKTPRIATDKKHQFENAVMKVLKLAEFLNIKSKTATLNGWEIKVIRTKKVKTKKAESPKTENVGEAEPPAAS